MADTLPLPIEHTHKVAAAAWGQPIASVTCPTCDTALEAGAPVCHVCGHTFTAAHVVKAQAQAQSQETTRAIVLIVGVVLLVLWFAIVCGR